MGGQVRDCVEVIGRKTYNFASDCGDMCAFVGEIAVAMWQAVLHPRRVRWRETLYYMDMTGSDAVPIVAVITYLMGLILGFQAAVQMQRFGGDIFVADLVALSIVKELGPLMVAIIATGRAGSAFAAEIGTMKVSEEVDAMVTLGLVPSRFLVVPKVLAMLVTLPLLTVFGSAVGIVGGLTVGTLQLDLPSVTYLSRTVQAVSLLDITEGLLKSVVFAVLVAGVGCMRGFETGDDAQAVGRSATSAVVSGIFLIIVFDCIITMLFSMGV